MKHFIPVIIGAAVSVAQSATAVEVGSVVDLTPNLRGTVVNADGENHHVSVFANPDNRPVGELTIDNTYFVGVNNYTVTDIAAKGFSQCQITGITTGPDMKIIGSQAFHGCTKLAYFRERIPGSVEIIGDEAFSYTNSLQSISLPAVERIGTYAFMRSGIKSATFTEIVDLDGAAFYECFSLASFSGGEKLQAIGNIAFCNCKVLSGVTLGPGLKSMGTMTLAFTAKLTQTVVPSSMKAMGKNSFQGSALNRVFILSPDFMDFCDESRLLCNSNLKNIYCLKSLVEPITKYLTTGSTDNPASTLAKATAAPITEVFDLEYKDNDRFAAVSKLDGITDLHVYDAVSGAEILPSGGFYDIKGDAVRVAYRIDTVNLLDYTMPLMRSGSVGGIEIDDPDNDSAEYYDLHGVRVDTPAAGQLLIKRQGTKATKIISQ